MKASEYLDLSIIESLFFIIFFNFTCLSTNNTAVEYAFLHYII